MNITRMHNMNTQQEARDWVDAKLDEMKDAFGNQVYDVSGVWNDNVLRFRFRIGRLARFQGTLIVTRDCLHLDLPFPLLARLREGTARAAADWWLGENPCSMDEVGEAAC